MVWSVFAVAEAKRLASECLAPAKLWKEHTLKACPIARWRWQNCYLRLIVSHDTLSYPCAFQHLRLLLGRLYNHQFPTCSHNICALKNRCISSPVTNLRLLWRW